MADPNNIREMKEEDLGRVCEIWLKEIKETSPALISEEPWESKLPNLKSEAQDSKNQRYVYEEAGKIKGFIIAGILNGSPYLYELYVDDQRKGIGTILLDKIRKIYRYLESDVYKCNPYLKFYLKCGFEDIREHLCHDTGCVKLRIRWELNKGRA